MNRPWRYLLPLLALWLAVPVLADTDKLKCGANQDRVWVYDTLTTFDVGARLKCGESVEIVSRVKGYVKIHSASGAEGYVPDGALPDLPPLADPENQTVAAAAASAAPSGGNTASLAAAAKAALAATKPAPAVNASAVMPNAAVAMLALTAPPQQTAPAASSQPPAAMPAPVSVSVPAPVIAKNPPPVPAPAPVAIAPPAPKIASASAKPAPTAPVQQVMVANSQPVAPKPAPAPVTAPAVVAPAAPVMAPVSAPVSVPAAIAAAAPVAVAPNPIAAPAPAIATEPKAVITPAKETTTPSSTKHSKPVAPPPVLAPAPAKPSAPIYEAKLDVPASTYPVRDIVTPSNSAKVKSATEEVPIGAEYPATEPADESADPACHTYFSAYGLSPSQFKWLAANRRKLYPNICPAPNVASVDFVILFTHDADTFNEALPTPVHTDRAGFSDFNPLTEIDTALLSGSDADHAHHEYVWVFRMNRGGFDPMKFSPRRRPQFSTTESKGSARAIEDALTYLQEQGSRLEVSASANQ